MSAALNFTVVLNTYQRPALLSRALAHYATCGPQVSAVRVVWSEQRPPPQRAEPSDARFFLLDSASQSRDYMPSVSYDTHPTSSINNRFAPLKGLSSDAVFSVDDDMAVPCNALLDAFEEHQIEFILPAHGYVLDSASAAIARLRAHRLQREAKILKVMQTHPQGSMDDWVALAYDDVDPRIWPVAKRSLLAHVQRLASMAP